MQVSSEIVNSPLSMSCVVVTHADVNETLSHLFFTSNKNVVPLSELGISNFLVDGS